jgi:hypothetical protein
VKTTKPSGSPVSHPDRPKSQRQAAKAMGVSRAELWRWKAVGNIPKGLLQRLKEAKPLVGVRELVEIGRLFAGRSGRAHEVERCPHCTGVLRFRRRWRPHITKVITDWLGEGPLADQGIVELLVQAERLVDEAERQAARRH